MRFKARFRELSTNQIINKWFDFYTQRSLKKHDKFDEYLSPLDRERMLLELCSRCWNYQDEIKALKQKIEDLENGSKNIAL